MKAITVYNPHALWIAMKWKTIETRTHDRFKALVGQRIAIHAAQKMDEAAFNGKYFQKAMALSVPSMRLEIYNNAKRCAGKILCTAFVKKALWCPSLDWVEREDWEKAAMCDIWDKYLIFLDDIKPLKKKIPIRGQQYPFEVPDLEIPDNSEFFKTAARAFISAIESIQHGIP